MTARSLSITLAIVSAVGCSSDTYPVTGKVTFKDGSPVSDARVIFRSKFEGEFITAFATTDENGAYSLTTWQTEDGAVPGEHLVIVSKPRQPREPAAGMLSDASVGGDPDLLPPEIHEKFADYKTTPLKFNVAKKENRIDLTVEPPE